MTQTPRAGRNGRWILLAGALSLPLGACSTVDSLFGSSPEPEKVQAEDTSQAPYPNLASVPNKPPPVSPDEIRRRVAEGLAADRANAQHGGALTPEQTAQPAASPPGPAVAPPLPAASTPPPEGVPEAPPPQAAPPPAAGGTPSQPATAQPAPTPAPAPAPATPATPPAATPVQTAPANVQMVAIVFFGHGAAKTDGRDAAVLAEVAKLHRQYGGIIRVVGYASAQASAAGPAEQGGNSGIAEQRAAAVAAVLKAEGVADAAVTTEARVASGPPPQTQMPAGAAGERRVEVYLEY